MTTAANKVEYGVSKLFIGTYTDNNGTITLGTPTAQPGAVKLSLEPQTDENKFYADNTVYWSGFSDNGFSGSIEVAMFSDAIKKAFFGYAELSDGGVAKIKQTSTQPVYIMFEAAGDKQKRRAILYNCTLGGINREYATTEDATSPTTETCDFTCIGDPTTGCTMTVYDVDATGYANLCDATKSAPVPASA